MQIIQSTSTSATFNLATEEYIFSESPEEILLFYVNEPSVIIGCNQAIQNEVNLDYCRENNIQIVRRMSGGGSVYHDFGNLNFCFISNKTNERSSLNPNFLKPIVEVLNALGIEVEVGKRKDLWLPGGFKISGTASHIGKKRELHHGTLLYDTDLYRLQKALSTVQSKTIIKAIPSVPSPVKNIRNYLREQNLPATDINDFIVNFTGVILRLYKLETVTFLSEAELEKIQFIQQNKYKLRDWIFKK
ncbi:MAG: lipoate--protein ligase family protein [Paludibacter sp.]